MRAKDFLTELTSAFVNKTVNKSEWAPPDKKDKVAKGSTASVWQHIEDPNTVVKLIGGGKYKAKQHHKDSSIAFVNFLVDHGKESKHLPIVHGINVDDNEVVQIKIEKLYPLPKEVGDYLYSLSVWAGAKGSQPNYIKKELKRALTKFSLDKNNSVSDIEQTIILLDKARREYKDKYNLPTLYLDLHEDNWLQTKDGIIVAADPWFSGF